MTTVRLLAELQHPDYPNVVYGRGHLLEMSPEQAFRLQQQGKVNVLDDQVPSPLVEHIVTPTPTTCQINWTTSMPTSGLVHYGTTTSYGRSASDPERLATHVVTLPQLHPQTTYHYQIVGMADGVFIESADFTFQTANPLEAATQPG